MNKSFIKLILGVIATIISMIAFIRNSEIGLNSIIVFIIYFLCSIPIFILYILKNNKVKWRFVLTGITLVIFALFISINVSKCGFIGYNLEIDKSSSNIEENYNNIYYDYETVYIAWDRILENTYFIFLYVILLICFKDYIDNKEGREDILLCLSFILCIIIYYNALFNPNLQKIPRYLEYNYITQNYFIFIIEFISLIIYKYINKKELCKM